MNQMLQLRLGEAGVQTISGKKLLKGKWVVKLTWNSGSKSFYHPENIFL